MTHVSEGWVCESCRGVNRSGPVVTEHDDGGESWDLRCLHCATEYPVARISARGVRLRKRLAQPMRDGKRAKLRKEMEQEVAR
jgi:hypothetical protein